MSDMSHELFEAASKIAKEAVKLDKSNKWKPASEKYLKAADILLKLSKITENSKLKNICLKTAEQYIRRSKELRRTVNVSLNPVELFDEKEVEPEIAQSVSSTILIEKPSVQWSDVADLKEAKQALREAVILPMIRPDLFTGSRVPWRGILLFGPPGCGKTFLSKAVANEAKATFFSADAASLVSKWLGESEKAIKTLFKTARERAPSIIFIDEIDAIASTRDSEEVGGERRLKTQMLIEMDGVKENKTGQIMVLGATNRPWDLDPAFRRRFEKRIYIPLPDKEARREVFKYHLKDVDLDVDVDLDELAEKSEGYTSSDIALICRESAMIPIRELDQQGLLQDLNCKPRPVNMSDLLTSLSRIKPVVTPAEIKRYEEWASEYRS
ncbi:MAG: ATP-binding protein [Candidatus Odinarchaeum yellowstonii]|uniref:ATP-binding protein n=1 Tax=Odinarchaeota yellowstonii (strain LCB_4) TaxID=1841599 RepID=A0AAF0D1J2_ODILC|nr:MAG: ATP-binding protein [Candidatus Odinarchaeum yellowstonii]